jgi:hypothetical protein
MTDEEIELDEAIRAVARGIVRERPDARESNGNIRTEQAFAAQEAFGEGDRS